MIWKTTNGLGQEVTWYDAEELNKIKYKLYLQCNSCGKPDIEITNGYGKCDFCDIGEVLKIIEGLENGQETS